MKYCEDLNQQIALLFATPKFVKDVEKLRNKTNVSDDITKLLIKFSLPSLAYNTIHHYLRHDELLIPTGYGFRYEKDSITGNWIERMEFEPDFPTRYAQQAFKELNRVRLLPKKRRKRKSTYFQKNLVIYSLAEKGLSASEIEIELKKLGEKSSSDEWSIRQTTYRQRKRLKI
jgi:hypothetical protein